MINAVIEKINNLLKKANFETFVLSNFATKKSKFCFDLLVKKDDAVFSVKVFPNIDNLNPALIQDIKSFSLMLKSKPLLIGIKNRYQKLEDNTIYVRDGLPFITFNTFEKILTNNVFPHILARRGGGVIFMNGNLMKKIREEHSITRKELSEQLGVAKRTVSAYENESMRPSEEMAEKILSILENNAIFKNINIFKWNIKYDMDDSEIYEEKELSDFEAHVQDIIENIGISSYYFYKKGAIPFKLSLYSNINNFKPDGFYPLFSGISEDKNRFDESSFKCLKMFTDFFQKTSLYIVNNNIHIPDILKTDTIPILKIKNLEEVEDEGEFIELIQK
ncbi:MAG: helix-turn-helix domain-containing protein [Candidatus Lokiarchaeota archaeon]|nr:helix-turn-helix domain-containing protein [Candidatus Lokiarchaeota archaeon]